MGGAVTRSRAGVATRLQQGASNEASVAVKDEAADTSSLLNGPIVKEEEDSLATRILSESSSKGKKRAVEVFQTDAAKRVKAESNTDGADVQVEQGVKTETTADADQFTSSATPARGYRGGGRKTTTKGKGKAKETKAEKEEAESTTAEAANKPKPKTIKAKGKASNASAKAEDSKYGPAVPGRATTSKSAPKKEATKAEVTTPPLPPEKREAVYRPAPSQSILDRVSRVMNQRMFLVDRQRNGEELKEVFQVLGSTGNVYTVTIDHTPKCNCPDFVWNKNLCKHVIFVFLKVLGLEPSSRLYYRKALLTSELEHVFEQARPAPMSVASPALRAAYIRAKSGILSDAEKKAERMAEKERVEKEEQEVYIGKRKMLEEGDACPICYEDFTPNSATGLRFCSTSCGNPLHETCFAQWKRSRKLVHAPVTCVWCRAIIPEREFPSPARLAKADRLTARRQQVKKGGRKGDFVNLAAEARVYGWGGGSSRDPGLY